jgi:short-subunit dehydrogenase
MHQRRRFRQSESLEERLAEEANRLRAEAKLLLPGAVRDEMMRKARQAETGSHMTEWLTSPGLRPPE